MTNLFPGELTSDDKLWAMLTYLLAPLVPIIVLLMPDKRDRPYAKANTIQALILGIITVVTSSFCVGILFFIYQIYLAIQAYNGKVVVIPVLTNLCKGQGWA
jgi:uncharacterized membrane protein